MSSSWKWKILLKRKTFLTIDTSVTLILRLYICIFQFSSCNCSENQLFASQRRGFWKKHFYFFNPNGFNFIPDQTRVQSHCWVPLVSGFVFSAVTEMFSWTCGAAESVLPPVAAASASFLPSVPVSSSSSSSAARHFFDLFFFVHLCLWTSGFESRTFSDLIVLLLALLFYFIIQFNRDDITSFFTAAKICICPWLHAGSAVSALALQQKGLVFDSWWFSFFLSLFINIH